MATKTKSKTNGTKRSKSNGTKLKLAGTFNMQKPVRLGGRDDRPIYAYVGEYKGKTRFEIRELWTDENGYLNPGGRGLSFPVELKAKIQALIAKV